jgi:hypothetical protein
LQTVRKLSPNPKNCAVIAAEKTWEESWPISPGKNGGRIYCFPNNWMTISGSRLIADFVVTDHGTDHGLQEGVAGGVKGAFGLERIEAAADKGYQDREDLMRCLEGGIIPYVSAEGEDGFELETVYEGREIGEEDSATALRRCPIITATYYDFYVVLYHNSIPRERYGETIEWFSFLYHLNSFKI